MKMKLIVLMLVVVLGTVMATGCGKSSKPENTKEDQPKEMVQISNPWTRFESLEEAVEASGISLKIPDNSILSSYEKKVYSILDKELIEAKFSSEAEDDKNSIYIRKGATEDDISGDYSTYSDGIGKEIDGVTVTFKGNGGKNNTASWVRNGCFYYVMFQENADLSGFESFVADLVSMNAE